MPAVTAFPDFTTESFVDGGKLGCLLFIIEVLSLSFTLHIVHNHCIFRRRMGMSVQRFESVLIQPLLPAIGVLMRFQSDLTPFRRAERDIAMISVVVDLCFASQLSERCPRLICVCSIFGMNALPFL